MIDDSLSLRSNDRMCEEAVAHGAYVAGAMSGYGVGCRVVNKMRCTPAFVLW